MSTLNDLMTLGREGGLSGKKLMEWVTQKQTDERKNAEQEHRADMERISLEKEVEVLSLARAKVRLETQVLEARRSDMERLNLEKEVEEIALARTRVRQEMQAFELETVNYRRSSASDGSQLADEPRVLPPRESEGSGGLTFWSRGPEIPPFNENTDVIDSYIVRFERYAEQQNWTRSSWAVYLSALLKGEALVLYASLPNEVAIDYDRLREALLKRYGLTEEGFRTKSRGATLDTSENMWRYSLASECSILNKMSVNRKFARKRDKFVSLCCFGRKMD